MRLLLEGFWRECQNHPQLVVCKRGVGDNSHLSMRGRMERMRLNSTCSLKGGVDDAFFSFAGPECRMVKTLGFATHQELLRP